MRSTFCGWLVPRLSFSPIDDIESDTTPLVACSSSVKVHLGLSPRYLDLITKRLPGGNSASLILLNTISLESRAARADSYLVSPLICESRLPLGISPPALEEGNIVSPFLVQLASLPSCSLVRSKQASTERVDHLEVRVHRVTRSSSFIGLRKKK